MESSGVRSHPSAALLFERFGRQNAGGTKGGTSVKAIAENMASVELNGWRKNVKELGTK